MSFFDKIVTWLNTPIGGEEPIELTPEKPKRSPEELMIQAICLDMQMYPTAWTVHSEYNYEGWKNKEADIIVKHHKYKYSNDDHNVYVNEVKLPRGIGALERIEKAYSNRQFGEILEKLIDRIEKVQTVSFEDVKEEVRPKTVDPFAEDHMKNLLTHMVGLSQAAEQAKRLPPLPLKISPSGIPRLQLPNPSSVIGIRGIK